MFEDLFSIEYDKQISFTSLSNSSVELVGTSSMVFVESRSPGKNGSAGKSEHGGKELTGWVFPELRPDSLLIVLTSKSIRDNLSTNLSQVSALIHGLFFVRGSKALDSSRNIRKLSSVYRVERFCPTAFFKLKIKSESPCFLSKWCNNLLRRDKISPEVGVFSSHSINVAVSITSITETKSSQYCTSSSVILTTVLDFSTFHQEVMQGLQVFESKIYEAYGR